MFHAFVLFGLQEREEGLYCVKSKFGWGVDMETIGVRIASSGMNSTEGSACTPTSTTTTTTGSIVSEDTMDSRTCLSSNTEDSSAVTIPCTTDCPSSIDSSEAQRTDKHGSRGVKPVS